jgi:hypothetical protein
METPQTLKQHEQLEYTQGELRQYDPTHGGIYDEDTVRAMEQFSQTRRLTNNVGIVLAEQGSKFTDPSHISPHELWQEIPVVSFDGRSTGPLGDRAGSPHPTVGLLQGPLICIGSASPVSGGPPDLGLSVPPIGRRPPFGSAVDGNPTWAAGCMACY